MGKILLRGFLGIAPIAITIILIVWLYSELEFIFSKPVKWIIGPEHYFSGLGVLVAIVLLCFVGLILNNWLIQRLYNAFESLMKRIPLLKTIYISVNDLMSFFHTGQKHEKGKVVIVDVGGIRMLGLVTRETFDDLPPGIGNGDDVAVFFPFSYQIGGFTTIVPRSKIQPVDFSVEKGLRWAVTAGNPSGNKPTYSPEKPKKNSH